MSGLPDEDTPEGDVFWTEMHNMNRMGRSAVDPAFALQNALDIAQKDGDPGQLAFVLKQRGCPEPQWVASLVVRESRWARLLHWCPHDDHDGGAYDDEPYDPQAAILRAIKTLPINQASQLLDIVAAAGPKAGRRGRTDTWPLHRLADLACDVIEADGTLVDRYKAIATKWKMTPDAIKQQYLRARDFFGLKEIK